MQESLARTFTGNASFDDDGNVEQILDGPS